MKIEKLKAPLFRGPEGPGLQMTGALLTRLVPARIIIIIVIIFIIRVSPKNSIIINCRVNMMVQVPGNKGNITIVVLMLKHIRFISNPF